MDQKGFFEGVNSKTSFSIGLLGGLGVAFAIGFFILLSQVTSDDSERGSERDSDNTVAQAPSGNQPSVAQPAAGTPPSVDKDDHIDGPKDASVFIVEFSDIQCPFCQRFHPTVQQIRKDYKDDVAWVYKHFPLDSIHPQARTAAEASECVADQKGDQAFFAYLDALFTQQQSLGRDLYINEATKLGASEKKFTDCLDSGQFKDKINQDYQEGIAAGVRGTPASYINGQLVSGAQEYEAVKAVVEQALQ